MAASWPAAVVEQYQALQQAAAAGDFANAQRTTAFLSNVLASVPAFSEDLAAVRTPAELICRADGTVHRAGAPARHAGSPRLAAHICDGSGQSNACGVVRDLGGCGPNGRP